MKREFFIETPLGRLKVWSKYETDSEDDFPGVYVGFVPEGKEEIILTCVEYESCKNVIQTCVYSDALDDMPSEIVEHENLTEEQ